MNDPGFNNLLKWGIQNSQVSQDDSDAAAPPPKVDADALRRLLGGAMGPSDAELMVESMNVVDNKDAELEHKLVAFDNFEQLIENLDNANNIQNLKLWDRLVNHLDSDVPDLRMYAAWCCAIAVQNNLNTQERLLIVGAIPTLVRLATEDTEKKVRKKAILALSSAIRNFQPSLDAAVPHLPAEYKPKDNLDANDMDSVDIIINKLRENM